MSASTTYTRLYALPVKIRSAIEARYDGPIPEEAVASGEALAAAWRAAQAIEGAIKMASPRRQISLRISTSAWRALQKLKIETGRPVNKLLIDAVDEYLAAKAPCCDL